MAGTPSGTVTVLFTDLVGSTELRQALGEDEAETLRRAHFFLLRSAVATHGGHEVKNLGDGLMVVFPSAVDALACAVAMEQAVHRHNLQQDARHRFLVRVGVHAGEPIREEGDYFGTTVDVAGRLCDSADGGQIVASELVRGLVGSRGGYTFEALGALSLKGIAEPLPACAVLWEPALEEAQTEQPSTTNAAGPLPLPARLTAGERMAFVGRERELAALRRYWERAREGNRQLVFLQGEPGIGKTRLAAELATAASAAGASVLFGRCDEEALISYQPFVEALQHYVAACPSDELPVRQPSARSELVRLVAEPPAAESEEERRRLREAITKLLQEASQARPVVLILDDLQWADKQTTLLLRRIVRSPQRTPLLILGTYREAELAPAHPLWETLADLRRDRLFEKVVLGGLDRGDVVALIGAWAGQESPAELAGAIYERTEGNPFFVEEVLRDLSERGAMYERGGRLTTDRTFEQLRIPEGVKEVIGQRLSRLSDECNSVLTIASVIGREFGLDALERASDLSSDRLVEALEEAVAVRVVAELPHQVGRYSFSHALIHETLYDELTTTRRVRLHGQTLQYADSNGVKLAYEVLGASGPYVTVAGLSNCPALRPRMKTVARHWDRISSHCRLVLYDRRGVGFSAAPDRGYSLLASVEDLRAVMDAAGVERTVLWGSTDGGPLAIAFAVQYPERVAGLLLLGTTAKLVTDEDFTMGINPTAIESFLRTDALDQGGAASQLSRTRHLLSGEADSIGEVLKRVPRQAWAKILGALGAADVRSLLSRVRAPALIVHDPENDYIPAQAAHYLHERMPNSILSITDEYGAVSFGEGLYRQIEGFIEQVTARSVP